MRDVDVRTLVKNVPNVSDIDGLADWFAMCESYGKSVNSSNISHSANNGLTFLDNDDLRKKHRQQVLSCLKTELYNQEGENLMLQYEYDVFLSHAHADKESFVADLKRSFEKLGIKIFYDTDSIKWGNNWKKKIYEGLDNCRFAVIVISDDFYGRKWTEKELKTLLTRQNSNGEEVILPILYNTTLSDMQNHYKSLADIQFLEVSDTCDIKDITIMLAERLLDDYAKTVQNI